MKSAVIPMLRETRPQSGQKWTLLAFAGILIFGTVFRFIGISDRMTHVDDMGFLAELLPATSHTDAASRVSNNWTYGPSQFRLTWLLAKQSRSWSELLFFIRLPSAIFSTLGLMLFALGLLVIDRGRLKVSSLVVLAFAAFSVQSLMQAQQGYVYASTFFASSWIFLGLACLQTLPLSLTMWSSATCALTLLSTWLITVSYQNIFLLAGSYLGLAPLVFSEKSGRRARIGVVFVMGLCSLGYVAKIYKNKIKPLQYHGYSSYPGWAREDSLTFGEGVLDAIWNPLKYISGGLQSLGFYQLTPVWPAAMPEALVLICKILALLLLVWGLCSTISRVSLRGDKTSAVSIAVLTTFSIFFLANLANVVPFGGTRHSYILLLPILWFLRHVLDSQRVTVFSWLLVVLIFGAFLLKYPAFHRMTENNYDLSYIDSICRTDHVSRLYEFGYTKDYYYAQSQFPAFYACPRSVGIFADTIPGLVEELDSMAVGTKFMISSRTEDFTSGLQQSVEDLDLRNIKISIRKQDDGPGSSEPMGKINGGNSIYLAVIERI